MLIAEAGPIHRIRANTQKQDQHKLIPAAECHKHSTPRRLSCVPVRASQRAPPSATPAFPLHRPGLLLSTPIPAPYHTLGPSSPPCPSPGCQLAPSACSCSWSAHALLVQAPTPHPRTKNKQSSHTSGTYSCLMARAAAAGAALAAVQCLRSTEGRSLAQCTSPLVSSEVASMVGCSTCRKNLCFCCRCC